MLPLAISLISLSGLLGGGQRAGFVALGLAVALLGGCHVVFGLADPLRDATVDDVGDGRDAKLGDAPPGDSTVISDGRLCWDPMLGHDEDGDGVKDGCDNCPAVKNFDQVNDDGDDLGDVCDPHPSHEDRIALWHNFAAGVDSGWKSLPGMGVWMHDPANGAYAQVDGANGGTVTVYGARRFTDATVEVVITGTRSPINLNAATAGVYLWTDKSPPVLQVPDGVLCIERRPNSQPVNDITQIIERLDNTTASTMSGNPIVGSRSDATYLRVSSKHDGQTGMVGCALRRGTSAPQLTVSTDPSGAGFIALGTGNTAALFHSVLVSELVP